tara:strand:- start:248 stop:979 length:732 start_codon:yes stop_codon:yes gene_type:complete
MKKSLINRFVEKYNLGGNINSVVLSVKDNKLTTRFITDDKSLLGEMTLDKFTFDDCELGVYSTDQLVKLLGVVGDDIDVSVAKAGEGSEEKAVSFKVSDKAATVTYMLSDLSVINRPPNLKQLPDFVTKIKVDKGFMDTFIKGKNALPDVDNFTVVSNSNNVDLVIGYSEISTNRVTIPVTTTEHQECENISFNAKLFKDVLTANKECSSATLEVSDKGLARISFKVDDYSVTYYLVAVDEVD